jgi:hypothetical protein
MLWISGVSWARKTSNVEHGGCVLAVQACHCLAVLAAGDLHTANQACIQQWTFGMLC